MNKTETERTAYYDGVLACNQLRIGESFHGIELIADKRGYTEAADGYRETEREAFIAGFKTEFSKAWPNGIRVDANLRIEA